MRTHVQTNNLSSAILRACILLLPLSCCLGCTTEGTTQDQQETIELSTHNLIAQGYFGLLTTEKYENNWQAKHCKNFLFWEFCYAWEMTDAFGDVFDDWNYKRFRAAPDSYTGALMQEGYDTISPYGADLQDVEYIHTHGWLSSPYDAAMAMWNEDVAVGSSAFRFGDDDRGLKLFIAYSCHQLEPDDGYWSYRWNPAFRGGLKLMLGSSGTLSWGTGMWATTHDLAVYITNPAFADVVAWSWYYVNTYAEMEQDIAVMASGTNMDNCWYRMWNYNYDDLLYWGARLQDGDIGAYCLFVQKDIGG